jgi:hypothetical protein
MINTTLAHYRITAKLGHVEMDVSVNWTAPIQRSRRCRSIAGYDIYD